MPEVMLSLILHTPVVSSPYGEEHLPAGASLDKITRPDPLIFVLRSGDHCIPVQLQAGLPIDLRSRLVLLLRTALS